MLIFDGILVIANLLVFYDEGVGGLSDEQNSRSSPPFAASYWVEDQSSYFSSETDDEP